MAEGVEDADTWNRLASVGCDLAQGYHLSQPVPAAEIPTLAARETPDRQPTVEPLPIPGQRHESLLVCTEPTSGLQAAPAPTEAE